MDIQYLEHFKSCSFIDESLFQWFSSLITFLLLFLILCIFHFHFNINFWIFMQFIPWSILIIKSNSNISFKSTRLKPNSDRSWNRIDYFFDFSLFLICMKRKNLRLILYKYYFRNQSIIQFLFILRIFMSKWFLIRKKFPVSFQFIFF